MLNVLVAILGISFVVVIHEAGHYVAARASGIRVTHFSIGFGPVLLKFRLRGSPTQFQICAIPFLAYVAIAGMNPEEECAAEDRGVYWKKSLSRRMITVLGGPLANYLLASFLIFGLALQGWREDLPTRPMVVAKVEKDSAAARAGLRAGDIVREANGRKIADVSDLSSITASRAGEPTTLLVERNGERLPLVTLVAQSKAGRGVIGVWPRIEARYTALSAGDATRLALVLPYRMTLDNLAGIVDLVRHRTTEGLKGPVGMSKMVAEQAGLGVYALLSALASISVGLGLFNLLPIPFLDGGRLLFLGCEAVTGRRPNERAEVVVHAMGAILLLAMTVMVRLRDVLG